MSVVVGISLVLLLLGLIPLAGFVLRGYRSESWPAAFGKVTVSRVYTEPPADDPSFRLALEYRFPVAGKEYSGYRIRVFDWLPASREAAEKALARYPVGALVTVRYRPSHPQDSVLEPGLRCYDVAASIVYAAVCIFVAFELAAQLGFLP